ncbi:hypothetical protein D3C85_1639870 [compost metagenome]
MGRTSVQNLLRGKVAVSCGFSVVPEEIKPGIDLNKDVFEIGVSELLARANFVLESISNKSFFV